MTIRIRDATTDDWQVIATYNQALAGETEDKRLDDAVLGSGVRHLLDDPSRGRYFLAEVDGEVVGTTMITYEWSDWRDGWFWWIQSVYVAPDHRGGGVFRALYGHVEQAARAAGDVCGLRLYVLNGNERARRVYGALGMADADYRVLETLFD